MKPVQALAALFTLMFAAVPLAAQLVVVDARGGGLKSGQKIAATTAITLKEGERVTLIGPDGKSITLRGKFAGRPMVRAGAATDPKRALAALITTRNARTSSVGVVRGATDAAPLPQPWLIDISRAGERCLMAGERAVWWRPQKAEAQKFTVLPIDRSWRADFEWQAGQDMLAVPPLTKFEGQTILIIRIAEQEYAVSVNLVPADLDNDFVLASWLLEKGCLQQADALLRRVQSSQPALQ